MKRVMAALSLALLLTASSPSEAAGRPSDATIDGMGPIAHVAPWIQRVFTCVIWRESRSTWAHPNLADVSKTGSSGIFQMEDGPGTIWRRWAPSVGVHVPLWRASVLQQERVAISVYRHDGFAPWRDGCA